MAKAEPRSKIYPHIFRRSWKAAVGSVRDPRVDQVMLALMLDPLEAEDAVKETTPYLQVLESGLQVFAAHSDPKAMTAALETIRQWMLRKDSPEAFAGLANYSHRLSVWCALESMPLVDGELIDQRLIDASSATVTAVGRWVRSQDESLRRSLARELDALGEVFRSEFTATNPRFAAEGTRQRFAAECFYDLIAFVSSPSAFRSALARDFFAKIVESLEASRTVIYMTMSQFRRATQYRVLQGMADAVLSFPYRGD